MTNLDEYEQDILQSVENGEWESKDNNDDRLKELQSYIKHQKKKESFSELYPIPKFNSNINTPVCNK